MNFGCASKIFIASFIKKMNLLDNIFVNLRIISKIPENGKLSTTSPGQVSLETDSYFSKVWRTLTGDSRNKTVKFLQRLISDATEISDNMINSLIVNKNLSKQNNDRVSIDVNIYRLNDYNKKLQQLKKLVRELRNSKKGIANLHITYSTDADVTSKIEEIIDKIESQVSKIEKAILLIEKDERKKDKHKSYD